VNLDPGRLSAVRAGDNQWVDRSAASMVVKWSTRHRS
jgi:hypothetical protein